MTIGLQGLTRQAVRVARLSPPAVFVLLILIAACLASTPSIGGAMTIDSIAAATQRQNAWTAKAPDKQASAAPSGATQPVEHKAPPPPPSADALRAAVEQIETYLKGSERSLQFKVDSTTGVTVITVKDANGEVIRQIPNDEVLRLARSLGAGAKSLMDIAV